MFFAEKILAGIEAEREAARQAKVRERWKETRARIRALFIALAIVALFVLLVRAGMIGYEMYQEHEHSRLYRTEPRDHSGEIPWWPSKARPLRDM